MSEPVRKLQAVETTPIPDGLRVISADGEMLGDFTGQLQALEDQIAGQERDLRGWRARYADLKRDREAEAEEDPLWPQVVEVFNYWKKTCRHPRSPFTVDRFEMAAPYVKKFGKEMCMRAVDGIAFDPFVTVRKNGTPRRHDGWHLIFGAAEKFEERCNAAPLPEGNDDDAADDDGPRGTNEGLAPGQQGSLPTG